MMKKFPTISTRCNPTTTHKLGRSLQMAKAKGKYDAQTVKDAATGQWLEILASVCSIDPQLLNKKGHPCPKCSGTDRFSLVDEDRGAVICRKCFDTKNGDGFSAIQWMNGCTFPESIELVAKHLGLKATKRQKAKPDDNLEWKEWNETLAAMWCGQHKKGVTPQAMLDAGARLASYKGSTMVFALPHHAPGEPEPVGYTIFSAAGGKIQSFANNKVDYKKSIITGGSKSGAMNKSALDRLLVEGMVEVVWKVEGPPDMMALHSIIPEDLKDRHVVFCNASGCHENPGWMPSICKGKKARVVGDADKPGQDGAEVWTVAIAQEASEVRNVQLPYQIKEKEGEDLRDWINEGHTYDDLLRLVEQTPKFNMPSKDPNAVDKSNFDVDTLKERNLLKRLKLEVIGQDSREQIRIHSYYHQRDFTLNGTAHRLSYPELLRIGGRPVKSFVSRKDDPEDRDSIRLADVRDAILLLTGYLPIEEGEIREAGVWRGQSLDGAQSDTIILVGAKEAAKWNGDQILHRVDTPRMEGVICDFSEKTTWYDHSALADYCQRAKDRGWCTEVISQMNELFGRWRWSGGFDHELTTGLVMSTWIQTLWNWRPMVVVTGASDAGKSMLFEALGGTKSGSSGLFGNLVISSSQSSEAGIRQKILQSGKVVLLDEWDSTKERERENLLKTFRTASRGQKMLKGTANQKGTEFSLRHIIWLAGVDSGMQEQADTNRYIRMELRLPVKEKRGQLRLPSERQLIELGQKSLAIGIVHGMAAVSLSGELEGYQVEDVSDRITRNYSVPASIMAIAMGGGAAEAQMMIDNFTKKVADDEDEQGRPDQVELLDDILSSVINPGRGELKPVSMLLWPWENWTENLKELEAHGIALERDVDGASPKYTLFLGYGCLSKILLKNTAWQNRRLKHLLERCEGAGSKQKRMAGKKARVVAIPWDYIEKHFRPSEAEDVTMADVDSF